MKTTKKIIALVLLFGSMFLAAQQTAAQGSNCNSLFLSITQSPPVNGRVLVTANATGGTAPYTYLYWRDNNGGMTSYGITDTVSVSINNPLRVGFTVTDANGCSQTGLRVINSNNSQCDSTYFTLALSQTRVASNQIRETIHVNGVGTTPPYIAYGWAHNLVTVSRDTSSSTILNVLVTSNFNVGSDTYFNVTDANGCIAYAKDTIIQNTYYCQNTTLALSLTPTQISPTAVVASLHATGGAAPYTYSNNYNSSTSDTVTFHQNTAVCFEVKDSIGCRAFACDTIIINQNHPCDSSTLAVSLTNTPNVPTGGATIAATVTGGFPPYTYTNNFDSSTSNSVNISGRDSTVCFTVTDARGCSRTACRPPTNLCDSSTLALSVTNMSISGNQVQVTVNATGGVAPYTINSTWTEYSNNVATQNGSSGSSFIVTSDRNTALSYCAVVDANGCMVRAPYDTIVMGFNPACTNGGCVFPGDADHSGRANVYDVLVLGVDYAHTGAPRTDQTNTWYAHTATDWATNTPTIAVNEKHADCNGDGTINLQDLAAIDQNYNRTHNGTVSTNRTDLLTALPVYLQFPSDSIVLTAGVPNSIYADVFVGTSVVSAQNFYGIAMNLTYPSGLVRLDSAATATYDNASFVGQPSDVILFQHDTRNASATTGQLDIAVTRTNHTNVNGFGRVCRVHWIITENISGRIDYNRLREIFSVQMTGVRANDNQLAPIATRSISDQTVLVGKYLTATESRQWEQAIRIYPNPTSSVLHIDLGGETGQSAQLSNVIGESIINTSLQYSTTTDLDVSALAAGVYMLTIRTDAGVMTRKIVVQK